MFYNPLLLLVAVPVSAGLLCLPLADRMKALIKIFAILVTLFAFALSIFIFVKRPAPCAVFNVDNLSAFIAVGIAFFGLLVSIYSSGFMQRHFGRYFGYVLITLGSAFGVALTNDFIALMVFWGILAAMLYLLVNIQGTDRAAASAQKALIIIGGTDAAMMFGICLIWRMTGTFSMQGLHLPLNDAFSYMAYFSLAIAAFAKAGAMPFHSWLPDVAEDSPVPVTAYLPASLDKLLGIYLLARVSLNIFSMNTITNTTLAFFGAVTIVAAVIIALVQHDLKRLLGYHAVSQVGYMVLGIGTGTIIGIAGGLFHMLNNAIYKSCLFLSGGNVEARTGTTDLEKLGGLAKYMPVTFASFLIASLSISGIPPFNGFVSKWMIYQGIIESQSAKNPLWILWLTAAMFGSALTVASFMKLLHAVFMGRPSKDFRNIKEAPLSMILPVIILACLCVIFGIFAVAFPLTVFIMPSIGAALKYLGTWSPFAAAFLIAAGIITGFFIWFLIRPRQFRQSAPFVGGEDQELLGRISGAEFYNTIKEMNGLACVYRKEAAKKFDIYSIGRKFVSFFTGYLQNLHNGVLPTYVVWALLGMVGMFLILSFK